MDGTSVSPPPGKLPTHVAIIMDGNGRWAKERGMPRIEGHRQGAKTVRDMVTYCREIGIRYLTLYAFSSENWNRPPDEVSGLMDLLYEYLVEEESTLVKNGINFSTIGVVTALPKPVQMLIKRVKKATVGLDDMRLTLALSYGSRDEMTRALKKLARDVDRGELDPDEIDDETLRGYLDTHDVPDPDLMIRTSGETRISNFMLWQLAYTELWFTTVSWPDFTRADMNEALASFTERERRFGLTGEQITDETLPDDPGRKGGAEPAEPLAAASDAGGATR
jgi:undecaprenyl diphosphate synthase